MLRSFPNIYSKIKEPLGKSRNMKRQQARKQFGTIQEVKLDK